MNKRIIIATLAVAGVLALSGCAQNSDQAAVTNLALKDAKSHLLAGQTAATEGVWTWRTGYSVLTKTDGKNGKGPYTNWEAYGYKKSGDSWKLVTSNLVDSETHTPTKTPHQATCYALAGSDGGEQQKCAQLTD
jgi:hypothetical protein